MALRRRRPAGRADPRRRGLLARARRALPGADRAARPRAERVPERDGERALADASRPTRGARAAATSARCSACRSPSRTAEDVAGEVTTSGHRAPTAPAAARTASSSRRLRAAGAVIIGKTNLPELAIMGDTEGPSLRHHPQSVEHRPQPGGSSGGSAAAVAAGLCAAATASDGAGSIRHPAPPTAASSGSSRTRDLIPLSPRPEHWHGLSVVGFETRRRRGHRAADGVGRGRRPSWPRAAGARPPSGCAIATSTKPAIPVARSTPAIARAVEAIAARRLRCARPRRCAEHDPPYATAEPDSSPATWPGIAEDAPTGRAPRAARSAARAASCGSAR